MPVEVDLEGLLLTQTAYDAWQAFAKRLVHVLQAAGHQIDPDTVPDEQARVEDDGTLTIYVAVPNFGEVSLSVPAGQWTSRLSS